jgi:membrane-bound lytic murein transglycosylase D
MHFDSRQRYAGQVLGPRSVAPPAPSQALGIPAILALSVMLFGLFGCSHTPTQPVPSAPTPAQAAATAVTNILHDSAVDAATNEALAVEVNDAEPQTTEEVVANAVAEQNLLNRLRAGFALSDADHVNIDREVAWFARHPDYLDRTFRRAERYLFFIVEELEARNMPLELALLPIVESAFNPVALSHARAAGLWQFIPSTGKRYGLEQNHRYDGRRDIVESTRAALDYLQWLANEFDGDWYQAIAAYNSGEMNVTRAIARNQTKGRPTDFFNLDLPRETRAYVPKLLAIRRIVAEPEKYGLQFGDISNQPYFAKVELEAPVDLGVAAHLAGLPKEDLIALNPAFYRGVTNPDGPGHLLVPVDRAEQLRLGLAELSPAQRAPKIYYLVHRGDTVSSVARKLGVSQAELRAANGIKGNTLRVGQELVIDRGAVASRMQAPAPVAGKRVVSQYPNYVPPPLPPREAHAVGGSDTHRVRKGETLSSIARIYGVSLEALAMENKLDPKQRLAKGQKLWIPRADSGAATLATNDVRGATVQRVTYVVQSGDTLSRIAKMFHVEMNQVLAWNKLRNANSLRAGQKLVMYVDDSRRTGG